MVRAREDRERLINEAKGYQEDVIPKARGQAEQMVRAAEAYRAQRVIRAEGDAAKFIAVLTEYEEAREVTEQRLYVETLQRVLHKAQKIVIGPQLEAGILPFLPLREQGPQGLAPAPKVAQPGLHAKVPFVQTVHRFDKRVLATDAPPAEYLTLDKKRVVVDYVARWQITDPLAFFTSVATLKGAKARIEDIVFSELRRELASQEFAPVTSELREPTMDAVAKASRARTEAFGIELIDVRIKRADLPREVQQSVFARMVAERGRIAKRYRSEGEEEAAKLRGETDKQREIILAQASERCSSGSCSVPSP